MRQGYEQDINFLTLVLLQNLSFKAFTVAFRAIMLPWSSFPQRMVQPEARMHLQPFLPADDIGLAAADPGTSGRINPPTFSANPMSFSELNVHPQQFDKRMQLALAQPTCNVIISGALVHWCFGYIHCAFPVACTSCAHIVVLYTLPGHSYRRMS